MKKKDLLIFFGFVVAPLGFFAAGVYYGPKIKRWYDTSGKKMMNEAGLADELVNIKNIDKENKTITLSINKNPDIVFSYRGGGAPMAQPLNVPGIESNEIALRYIGGKFSVTDGEKVLFEKQIETIKIN